MSVVCLPFFLILLRWVRKFAGESSSLPSTFYTATDRVHTWTYGLWTHVDNLISKTSTVPVHHITWSSYLYWCIEEKVSLDSFMYKVMLPSNEYHVQLSHWTTWIQRVKTGVQDLERFRDDAQHGAGDAHDPNKSSLHASNRIEALCDTLEALREVGGLYYPMQILRTTDLIQLIETLKSHWVCSIQDI